MLPLTRLLLICVALYPATVDLLTKISVRGISLHGLSGVAVTVVGAFLIARHPRIISGSRQAATLLAAFLCSATLSAVMAWSVGGLQSLSIITAMAVLLVLVPRYVRDHPEHVGPLLRTLTWSVWLGAAAWGIGRLTPALTVGSRSFALIALIGVALHGAAWATHRRRPDALLALTMFALTGVSLSRTALIAGAVMLLLAFFPARARPRAVSRFTAATALVAALLYGILATDNLISRRFTTGDLSLQVGGISVNAEGRTKFWATAWESAWISPLIGQGPGSVEPVLGALYYTSQPHNDYLRLFHDYGLVGAGLFVLLLVSLLRATWRATKANPQAALPRAAWLLIIGLMVTMTTDNTIIYAFVMLPATLLIAVALQPVAATLSSAARHSGPLWWRRRHQTESPPLQSGWE